MGGSAKHKAGKESDQPLARRFSLLLERHSQAEIARRTGFHVANVNRYVNGLAVPAAFCRAVIEQFGVNPTWLMTGQGTPYLADIRAEIGQRGGELLELVEAMISIDHIRLGSLSGRPVAATLKKLDAALRRLEELQVRLDDKSRPLLRQLISDYNRHLERPDLDAAESTRTAARQILRLTRDPRLELDLLDCEACHLRRLGSYVEAAAVQERVFRQAFGLAQDWSEGLVSAGSNFASTLFNLGRMREAHRVCAGVLALTDGIEQEKQHRAMLAMVCAAIEANLWRLKDALQRAQLAFGDLSPAWRDESGYSILIGLQWLAGVTTIEAALQFGPDNDQKTAALMNWACWLEAPALIKRILARVRSQPPQSRAMLAYWQALLDALEGRGGDTTRTQEDERRGDAGERANFSALCARTHVAVVAGDRRKATGYLLECAELLSSMPSNAVPLIYSLAQHHRSVLRLIPADTRSPERRRLLEQARGFFSECALHGYRGLLGP